MKANGPMTKQTVMEPTLTLMEPGIKAAGSTISKKVLAQKPGTTVQHTRATTKKE